MCLIVVEEGSRKDFRTLRLGGSDRYTGVGPPACMYHTVSTQQLLDWAFEYIQIRKYCSITASQGVRLEFTFWDFHYRVHGTKWRGYSKKTSYIFLHSLPPICSKLRSAKIIMHRLTSVLLTQAP